MAGYRETPRQKMIAMMYLVLTALLALNVSKEILQAFIVVNESIETTTENFSKKLGETYADFDKAYTMSPDKVKEFYDKAQEAKKLSDEIVQYIEDTKWEVIVATDNAIETIEMAKATPLQEIAARDKYSEPTNYFFGNSPDGEKGRSGELRNKIVAYKKAMLDFFKPEVRDLIQIGLETDGPFYDADKQRQTWMQHNFYYSILAADVTILNKLVNEVRNAEFDVIKHLYASVNAEDFKFDNIEAKVIPKSNYVLKGDNYEADVIVAAWDSKQKPSAQYRMGIDKVPEGGFEGATTLEGDSGVVKISIPANALGIQKYAGFIEVLNPSGIKVRHPFNQEYIVGEPSLTVAATKMNVFYIGVENPVKISVPGIPQDRLRPSISTGTLRPAAGGEYVVTVPRDARAAIISVSADFDGQLRGMGKADFRVKRVPDPIATVAGKSSGLVPKSQLSAAPGVIPKMPDDFEFELFFEIQSFTFVTFRSGDIIERQGRGNRFTQEMKDMIENSRRGTKIWIENIIATGPDGNRQLGTIALQVQ